MHFDLGFAWPPFVTDIIYANVQEFHKYRTRPRLPTLKQTHLIAWCAPFVGFIKINVDTSAHTNPGKLALGGLARDSKGRWLFGFTRKIGWGHITIAKVFAIFFHLQIAWDQNYKHVVVESDFF